ncbi:MAG: TetR/AcrR family transcriptional regulator [Anaerolineae bacterium]
MKNSGHADDTLSRWDRRKERTHRRLIEVADDLFRRKGFDVTTVEEIAERADVAKGTFFNYFESKEALLIAVVGDKITLTLEAPMASDTPAPERIRLMLIRLWEALLPYRHLTPHMASYNVRPPKHRERPLVRHLALLIREGQAQNLFRSEVDAEVAATLLAIHFLRACMLDHASGVGVTNAWEDHLEQGLDILYHGVLA